jgi:hypothetical protein
MLTLDERVDKIIGIALRMPLSSAAPLIRAGILEAIEEERRACAQIAENACLVPPDGGSPTEDESRMCGRAAEFIRNRSFEAR